jgi:hypothetical protein
MIIWNVRRARSLEVMNGRSGPYDNAEYEYVGDLLSDRRTARDRRF